MNKRKSFSCCKIFYLFTGQLFLIWACLLFIYQEQIREFITYTALRPNPEMRSYRFWQISNPAQVMDIYMFNWTNAEHLYEEGVIPNFEEVGPYRFRRTREKFDIVFNENDTVSYKIRERYDFLEEGSKPLSYVINTINPTAAILGYRSRFSNAFEKTMKSIALSSVSSVTITRTVRELLFEGYEDNLMDIARPFSYIMKEDIGDRFGFLREKNATQLGSTYNCYIGNDDRFGRMLEYDYSNISAFYRGECGKFRGSSSEFYPRNRKPDYIEVFVPEFCTSSRFDYERDVVVAGINAYRYTSTYIFDNGDQLPENRCFCSEDGCLPNGVMNVSLCNRNTPSFASLPHFYNADPIYRTTISGMKPDKSKHEFFLTFEPTTGITYNYGIRVQMNMRLEPIEGIGFFSGVPDIMVPILYLDEVATLDDEVVLTVYILKNMSTYITYTYYTLFSLGLSIIIYVVISICRGYSRRRCKA